MIVEYKREFLLIKKEVKCGNEIYIIGMHVSPYEFGNRNNVDTNEWRLRK